MLLQKGTVCLIDACLCSTLPDNGSGMADVWVGGVGGGVNDTHKATENNGIRTMEDATARMPMHVS